MERRWRTKHSGRQKRPSAWPQRSDDRVRVLLEYPAHSTPSAMAKALDDAGYETLICEGTERCPIVAGGDCALVDGADVVVSGFGVTTSDDRELPAAIRSRHPEVPLVVECTEPTSERYPDLVGPSIHLRTPVSKSSVTAAVSAALAEHTMPLCSSEPPATTSK